MVATEEGRGAARIEAFGPAEWRRAVPMLVRGFPRRRPAFWQAGFERYRALGGASPAAPLGQILVVEGRDVGVLLTFASARPRPGGAVENLVNLCGWYVDEPHRWRALGMLRQAMRGAGTVYTDLTASPSVDRINEALGFVRWSEGAMIDVLPWAALRAGGDAEVVPYDARRCDLPPGTRALIESHRAQGCIAATLRGPAGDAPLLFRRAHVKGLPVAHLILAESRRAVIAQRRPVARFLLARGFAVLVVDADRTECPPGTLFRSGRTRWVKGPMDRDRVDYAGSELVALNLGA